MTPSEQGVGDGSSYEAPWSAALLLTVPYFATLVVVPFVGAPSTLAYVALYGIWAGLPAWIGTGMALHYYPYYRDRGDAYPRVTAIGTAIFAAAACFMVSGVLCLVILLPFVGIHVLR